MKLGTVRVLQTGQVAGSLDDGNLHAKTDS